jgi:hypothetical protein
MAAYITNRMRRHFYPASTLVLPGNPLFRKPTSNTTAMATRLVFVDGLGRPRLIAEAFLHEGGDIHLCLRVLDRQAIPRLVATLLLHRVEALRPATSVRNCGRGPSTPSAAAGTIRARRWRRG